MESQLSPVGRFETIMLATDGTEYSAAAEQAAIDMATKCGARLIAVRIVVTNPEYEAMVPDRVQDEAIAARGQLDALVQRAAERGLECQGEVRHGADPYQEIVEVAEEMRADVIVIGRRSRSDLTRLMVGDSTAKVIGHAPCSVLVVPRGAAMPRSGIAVGTDGSRLGDAASVAGANLARRCELPLTVISANVASHSAARREEAEKAIQRVRDLLARDNIDVEGIQDEGRPDEVIVENAKRRNADLIVVGSHGRTGLTRLLMGSVSERVIGRAECAVLVVKGA